MIGGIGTMCVDARLQPSQTASAAEHDRSRQPTALSDRAFDRRQKAKSDAANDAPESGGGDGEDMFARAGVAAE